MPWQCVMQLPAHGYLVWGSLLLCWNCWYCDLVVPIGTSKHFKSECCDGLEALVTANVGLSWLHPSELDHSSQIAVCPTSNAGPGLQS